MADELTSQKMCLTRAHVCNDAAIDTLTEARTEAGRERDENDRENGRPDKLLQVVIVEEEQQI